MAYNSYTCVLFLFLEPNNLQRDSLFFAQLGDLRGVEVSGENHFSSVSPVVLSPC